MQSLQFGDILYLKEIWEGVLSLISTTSSPFIIPDHIIVSKRDPALRQQLTASLKPQSS